MFHLQINCLPWTLYGFTLYFGQDAFRCKSCSWTWPRAWWCHSLCRFLRKLFFYCFPINCFPIPFVFFIRNYTQTSFLPFSFHLIYWIGYSSFTPQIYSPSFFTCSTLWESDCITGFPGPLPSSCLWPVGNIFRRSEGWKSWIFISSTSSLLGEGQIMPESFYLQLQLLQVFFYCFLQVSALAAHSPLWPGGGNSSTVFASSRCFINLLVHLNPTQTTASTFFINSQLFYLTIYIL